jgi:hypothetical protein
MSINKNGRLKDDVRPFGAASMRFVAGQGWVQVPHLFRVTLRTMAGRAKTYDVQTFHGRDKAVVMATEVHIARGGGSDTFTVNVEELGPTQPGGLMDAIDDRAEW